MLRVVDAGVVLRDAHAKRLGAISGPVAKAYDAFCAEAAPGIYGCRIVAGTLHVTPRATAMLRDGLPVRRRVSPMLRRPPVLLEKPPSPSPYDEVREPGWCTLLTNESGEELIESCVGVLVGWDGTRPRFASDRLPRVRSVSECVVRESIATGEAVFRLDGGEPFAVMNAVSGLCLPALEQCESFPDTVGALIASIFENLTRR